MERQFEDLKIHVKFKLSALWVSVMLCYIYGDFFGLFKPGAIKSMLSGKMVPLWTVTQEMLLGVSAMMSIPSLMVFLSLALKPLINRWLNIIFGGLYTVIMIITLPGAWHSIYF